jgi:hypothetical protein
MRCLPLAIRFRNFGVDPAAGKPGNLRTCTLGTLRTLGTFGTLCTLGTPGTYN